MNIVHLKYAIMVADLGSISKASEKLYIAQPNISRAIKELETDLNITIFDRGSKGMVLTPEGGRFITYGKRVLAQIDEMEKMFKETKKKDVFSISVPRSSYISEAFVKFSKSVNRNNVELLYRGEYNKGNMTDDMQHELANYLQELLKEDVFDID